MSHPPLLAPSLLGGDHLAVLQSAQRAALLESRWLHVDIMDGHFVPNLTFGPQIVRELRKRTDLFLDTHLMVSRPGDLIQPFIEAGASQLTIHAEAEGELDRVLEQIRKAGIRTGIAINPGTPIDQLDPYLEQVDLVLLMTVQPGFGGQSFREDVLPKIESLRQNRDQRNLPFRIEVDGGVDETTGPRCLAAGADTLVAGTAFFRADDPHAFQRALLNGRSEPTG